MNDLANYRARMTAANLMRIILVNFFVLTTAGFAQMEETYSSSFDKVWEATLAQLSARYQIQTIDKASGLIETAERLMTSDKFTGQVLKYYAIEPTDSSQVYDQLFMSAKAQVRRTTPTATTLAVAIRYRTTTQEPTGVSKTLDWQSGGLAERNVFEGVRKRLRIRTDL
jgi:hypothetical protein